MNRHHPYGSGNYEGPPYRRGGSSGGPGPDRSHHHRGGSRGRGFGRGRGGYHHGGYDNGHTNSTYDQASHQSDIGPYNNYDAPSQDSFYQNGTGSYGGGGPSTPTQFNAPAVSDGYNQGYGNYEGALELRLKHMHCEHRKRQVTASFKMRVERTKTGSFVLSLVWWPSMG